MSKEAYIPIAKLGKTHGLSGALNIYFSAEVLDSSFPVLFVQEPTGYIPYFVKEMELNGDKGYITFEESNSKEGAKKMVNKEVCIQANKFAQYFKEIEEAFDNLVGYTAYDGPVLIGVITEIFDNSPQLLAEIKSTNQVHLIPLVEEFIVQMDPSKKTVILQLPDGLLQL